MNQFALPTSKPRNDEEDRLQMAVVQYLRLMGDPDVIWWHTPNQGVRSKRTAGRLKAMGVLAGIPDLTFVFPGGVVAMMELKTPKGVMSKAQKALEEKCHKLGVEHAVCYSIDTALEVLRWWKVLPEEAGQWRGQRSDD